MEGFELLSAGLALFITFHLMASVYSLRNGLVKLLGLQMYKVIYSAVATFGLVLIVMGWMDRPMVEIYQVPEWGFRLPLILMPIALTFLAGAHMSKDVKRWTRHPMLWGIFLWSLAHLFANGDQASVMLFGSFLFYSVFSMVLSDDKMAKSDPEHWAEIKAATSLIPFVALFQGRAKPATGDRGFKAFMAGIIVFMALVWAHQYFTGVPLLPY